MGYIGRLIGCTVWIVISMVVLMFDSIIWALIFALNEWAFSNGLVAALLATMAAGACFYGQMKGIFGWVKRHADG